MRLAAWMLALAATATCGRRDDPPDEGGRPDLTWRVHQVPECGFSVELAGPIDRSEDARPELQGVRRVMYANVVGHASTAIVYCELYPEGMELPDADGMLAGSLRHVRVSLAGLGGGITGVEHDRTTVAGSAALRYRVSLANGLVQDGVIIHAGRQMHSMSVVLGEPTHGHLDRIVASYKRR